MGVLDRLPERGVGQSLKQRMVEGNELKGSPQLLGSDSVVTHRIFSASTYDVQMTPVSAPGTVEIKRVDVEFIPDDLTFGGAFCHKLEIRALNLSNLSLEGYQPEIERLPIVDGRQRWAIYQAFFGFPEDAVRLKLYFFATGSGTFVANVVN